MEEQNEQKLKKLKSFFDTVKSIYNKENEKKQILCVYKHLKLFN